MESSLFPFFFSNVLRKIFLNSHAFPSMWQMLWDILYFWYIYMFTAASKLIELCRYFEILKKKSFPRVIDPYDCVKRVFSLILLTSFRFSPVMPHNFMYFYCICDMYTHVLVTIFQWLFWLTKLCLKCSKNNLPERHSYTWGVTR